MFDINGDGEVDREEFRRVRENEGLAGVAVMNKLSLTKSGYYKIL